MPTRPSSPAASLRARIAPAFAGLARLASLVSLAGLLAAGGLPGDAFAQPANGSEPSVTAAAPNADTLRPEIRHLLPNGQLVGKGRLTVWGLQVYDARLWALPAFRKDQPASQPFALELAYLRAFDRADIAERSIAEMRRAATITDAQAQAWTAELVRVLPDVKKGDRIIGVNRPGLGAQFFNNGRPGGEIRDPEFARLFFGIWLGPQTSEPQLRSALLAGAP